MYNIYISEEKIGTPCYNYKTYTFFNNILPSNVRPCVVARRVNNRMREDGSQTAARWCLYVLTKDITYFYFTTDIKRLFILYKRK